MVALLAEGVDRNLLADCWGVLNVVSPSSRRAWIEITRFFEGRPTICVALLAEGVDRNVSGLALRQYQQRRPPRGGRG